MEKLDEIKQERLILAVERLRQIEKESTVPQPYLDYFQKTASFMNEMWKLAQDISEDKLSSLTLEEWKNLNQKLYSDILPENYEKSYGNPDYAVSQLGEVHGRILSFLYAEIRSLIVLVFEKRWEDCLRIFELFLEVYTCFEDEELPTYRQIQQVIYWNISDYSDVTVARRVREGIDPDLDFAARIIMESDLEDLRYLYQYGEYINDSILKTAAFLNKLPQEEIDRIASVYTEGYRIGFVVTGKDLSKKKAVQIRYVLGFERIIRKAIENFEKMGLRTVIYRAA